MTKRHHALRGQLVAAGLAAYNADLRTVRGRCLGGTKRRPCGSRWGIVRVSLDFRDPTRVDRLARVECAVCGRVWRRVPPPPIRSLAGYQAVRLDVILPATAKRWYSRGRWHVEGTDAVILRDADLGDVDEAARAHADRLGKRLDARAKAKAKRDASDAIAIAEFREAIATMDAKAAERAAEERAAAERETAME